MRDFVWPATLFTRVRFKNIKLPQERGVGVLVADRLEQFDYVVIGGGHNGLAAACYLQNAGHSAVVFEATERLGGAAHTGALIPAAPNHRLCLGAQDDFYFSQSGIIEQLNLRQFGYQDADHSELAWLDQNSDKSLLLQRDWHKVIKNVEYFSPRDARRLEEMAALSGTILEALKYFQFSTPSSRSFLGALRRVLPLLRKRTRVFLTSLLLSGAEEYVLDQFESDAVRSLLLANASISGDINARGSATIVLVTFALSKWGSRRPIGGMQAIPDALARRFQSMGGITHTQSAVEEITFAGGRASGVQLTNGKIYRAKQAVMMAAAPDLLAQLVPKQHMSDGLHVKLKSLPMNANGAGPFKVDVALSGRLQIGKHQSWRNTYDGANLRGPSISSTNYLKLKETLTLAKTGKCAAPLPVWSTIFTERDQSFAPAGQDVLYLFTHLPVDIEGGWEASKERLADQLVADASSIYGNLRDIMIGRVVTSPKDFEKKWNIRNGQYYHVDNDFLRQGSLRPAYGIGGYRLPIPGIYLAGSGTGAGGGVGGLPGRAAALKALGDARKGKVH